MKSPAPALLFLLCVFFVDFLRAQDPAPSPDPGSAQTPAPAEAATQTPPPAPASFEISGIVRAGKTPLPGVTVTASNSLTGKKFSVATAANGTYTFTGLPRGRYVVRTEFMGFAPQTQEIVLKPETPAGKFDAEMILASRQQEQGVGNLAALITAGRGFQSLALDSTLSALAGGGAASILGGGQNGNGGDVSSLPLNGAGAEGPTESVSITGAQGRTQDFGGGSEDDIQERIQEFRDRTQREGGGLQGGGQGGAPGGGGGPGGPGGGPIMISRLPRNFNINQPHGMFYVSDDAAALDAKSYSLKGLETAKASYNLPRFGAFLGGPLNIPKIFNGGNKWFFFAGWNANRGSTPYDAFSTVPTLAERSGDFSAATYRDGSPAQIFNPSTRQQFQSNGRLNVIDPSLISPAAKALLAYIPLPNLNTTTQNFHYVTSDSSSSDSVNFRLIHNFGSSGGPGFGPFGGFGGGGAGGSKRAQNNINFGMNWTRSSTALVNAFPSLAGGNSLQGLNASSGWTYGRGRVTNMFRVNYNHNHVSTTNLYSNVQNVAGDAGIGGVSTDPFNWGLPGISFTTFAGFTEPTPRRELDQTYTFSDTLSWSRGKHNWRFGGDYRRILQSFRSAKNAEGSFVFTGLATSQFASGSGAPVANTGYDFADFLLGLPQQTTLQSGTNSYDFRANAFDVYVQDDFRFRPSLSFNLGLRYEYNGPYTEAHNQIANLDVAAGFAGAASVLPGQTGAFNGIYPGSLIHPDRNNFAPRIGIAWKPMKQTVVRAGYGVNYNLAQYGNIIQNFAFQPPFAITSTNVSSPANLLSLQNGFPATNASVTNNFAVDPNYRLGYVQIWNLDIQRQLPAGVVMNLGYNGSKGTRLDVQRAITVTGVQPFIYESSAGNSVFHSGSIRLRKRMAHGIAISGTYTYSKSIDDASSIGGGGTVVTQNPFDIAADRGLSSFDQRHKFSGNWIYELPFGENHRFAQRGPLSHILDGWQWSGNFTIGSGLYFTPRVLGNSLDISRGVSGSLRANATGAPISLSNPTTLQWFNTAAFCSPVSSFGSSTPASGSTCVNPNGSSFGDAGRNTIKGPRQITFDMNLSKTITIKESRALELRIQAANVFNTAHFTAINAIVNSLTYGEVTSAGSMRRVTMLARFRF
ncbi:MAG TPA: carboxypeptidase regulatory-like domain-containing protein [Candidatus Acidoferrum sp.]|nr:carboxypeptidase regulatory-like domain-containing protein [Candidatus Acidoferrum sp.]